MSERKERPILFSGPLVRAILSGAKTETRRPLPVVFNSPPSLVSEVLSPEMVTSAADRMFVKKGHWGIRFGAQAASGLRCPFGKPGDLLYVRETTATHWAYRPEEWHEKGIRAVYGMTIKQSDGGVKIPVEGDPLFVHYRADGDTKPGHIKWTPSIHMPKWAARIWLEVKSVRVERVQDITEEGAKAEGFDTRGDFLDCVRDIYGAPFIDDNGWNWVVSWPDGVVSTTGRPA